VPPLPENPPYNPLPPEAPELPGGGIGGGGSIGGGGGGNEKKPEPGDEPGDDPTDSQEPTPIDGPPSGIPVGGSVSPGFLTKLNNAINSKPDGQPFSFNPTKWGPNRWSVTVAITACRLTYTKEGEVGGYDQPIGGGTVTRVGVFSEIEMAQAYNAPSGGIMYGWDYKLVFWSNALPGAVPEYVRDGGFRDGISVLDGWEPNIIPAARIEVTAMTRVD
jgi:hypothetical protein